MAIRQLSRGKYQLVVDYYDSGGTRHRKTKVVETNGIKAARIMYDDFRRSLTARKDETCTLAELLESYIESCEIRGLSRNTIRGYHNCEKRINSAFGRVLAKDLTAFEVEQFIASMVKIKAYSPKTIKETISLMSAAYSQAIKQRLLSENPCEYVNLPKQKKKDIVVLKEDEIGLFLERLKDEPEDFKVLCEIALFCGLRLSEILGIKEEDVNTMFRNISVNKTRHSRGQETWFAEPKTARSRRVVGVPAFVLEDIQKLMDSREITSTDCLIQYNGEPMKASYAEKRMQIFKKKYGYKVTIHGLRHTFASMLNASKDFDIAEISAAMGHSSISTTLGIYTHTFQNQSHATRRIADSLERWRTDGANEVCDNEKTLVAQGF